MVNQFSRTELLIGKEGLEKLKRAKVAIFGIGGVGSFVVEALVRAGVYHLVLIDHDRVSLSNLNRQLIATRKTIGEYKVDVMKERILQINPYATVEVIKQFYMPDTAENFLDDSYSYIIDAIDTVTAKLSLVEEANKRNIPIISSMGTGNKIHPELLEITDIYKTSVCPLAKVMRQNLRKRGIKKLTVVYSKEEPIKIKEEEIEKAKQETVQQNGEVISGKKAVPGSISFVPGTAGLIIAGKVIRDLI